MKAVFALLLILLINPFRVSAQEETATAISEGKRYVDLRVKAIDKYNDRVKNEQKKLLKNLRKKEARLGNKLRYTDSTAYAKFLQKKPSFDSINQMEDADSATMAARVGKRKNGAVDGLKGVESFIQSKEATLRVPVPNPGIPGVGSTSPQLTQLQNQTNYNNYINDLISQRTRDLKSMAAGGEDMPGLTGIDKQVYYAKSKMNVYRQYEDDPTKAEDKALEYLQGTEGFSGAMNQTSSAGAGVSMQTLSANGMSAADMEKVGFQTKGSLQNSLQQKFGNNLSGLAGNMGNQVTQFQDKMQGITGDINNAKQTFSSAKNFKNIDKPSFKINPMRGLPLFWKRIERQYNWQTTKSTIDATGTVVPATLTGSAMLGFKQSTKFTIGAGVAAALGLGDSWNDVHFSFQGVGLRTYATWQWMNGIGFYAGYERMYKEVVFANQQTATTIQQDPSPHNTTDYTESVLIGLTKSYNINSKNSGSIQFLYDIWWKDKGMATPFVIRFATINK